MTKNAEIIGYRDVLKSLSFAEKRLLIAKTNHHGLVRLGGHCCLILVMAVLQAYSSGVLSFAAMMGQGIGMCFLFCAMHEASHETAFRSRLLGQVVTKSVGFLLFMGPQWFRYFHGDHHRFTQDRDRDPELAGGKPDGIISYALYLTGWAIWRSALVTLWRNSYRPSDESYVPQGAGQKAVMAEARMMMAGYIVIIGLFIAFAPLALWQFWIAPLLLGQPFLRLFLLAEHTGCPYGSDMLVNSRTVYSHWVVLWLSWNMPYHSAHHSFAAVPFHKLPLFHEHIRRHVRHENQGYHQFHRELIKGF